MILAWLGLLAHAIGAGTADQPSFYLEQVKPILQRRCAGCHGAVRQESGLRVDTAALLRKGGDGGPGLVAGKPAESRFLQAILGETDTSRMPLDAEPLPALEAAVLRRWVEAGAIAPEEPTPPNAKEHWSFRPPVRPPLPPAAPSTSSNPVDRFLERDWRQKDLVPRPPADRRTLLRRVSLDLVGLPPTPEELDAFVADDSPGAYERAVDRLLASPAYGERWGRHWMDVWRYSDWYGFGAEVRNSQKHIWRWRDWIVRSLNDDKPYDRMIVEMLAGDELAPCDPEALAATGYLARNWHRYSRNVWLQDTVEHVGKAFLGITFHCARCHDHMYDPISQEEYYRLRAVFEPHDVRIDRVAGKDDVEADGLPRVYDAHAEAKTFLFERGDEARPVKDQPLGPGLPELFGKGLEVSPIALPPRAFRAGLDPNLRRTRLAAADAAVAKARAELDRAREEAAALEGSLATHLASEPLLADDFRLLDAERWTVGPGSWRVRAEGGLIEEAPLAGEARIDSVANVPGDFSIAMLVRIVGGTTRQSAGLHFRMESDKTYDSIYLSAAMNGSKLQVAHTVDGESQYPREGAKSLALEVGRDYLLAVDVAGESVEVRLDGARQLTYAMPPPRAGRRPGRLALWTLDADAVFGPVEVRAFQQRPGAARTALEATRLLDRERWRRDVGLPAQRALAEGQRDLLQKKIEADDARFADPPAPDAKARIAAAALAEHRVDVLAAEWAGAQAQRADDVGRRPYPGSLGGRGKFPSAEVRKRLAAADEVRSAPPKTDYTPFAEVFPATSTGRRLALARWIASKSNPLTARVAINHLWLRHFGEPLVESVFDFGRNGKAPTHPELLDWLACELMENGWRMKPIHRLLVTSRAYRMESAFGEESAGNLAVDPDNRFLWRMNPRRMEAETVRDSVLFVAGSLSSSMGGPELDHVLGESTGRRSLYYRTAVEKQMLFLRQFDQASVTECYQRPQTIVPQQALAMANSRLVLAQSRRLAAAVEGELKQQGGVWSEGRFIQRVYERVLGRRPNADEVEACRDFLRQQALLLAAPDDLERFAGEPPLTEPAADPNARARENLVHVLLNHNDFVTVR